MKENKESSYLEVIKKTLPSSIIAGTVIAYTTFPAEGYKKYLQSGQTGRFHWYRGSTLFALNIIPTTTIQFTTNAMLNKVIDKNPPLWQSLGASFVSGITAASTATVVENTIVRQQVLKCGPVDVLKDMYQHGGLARFWKTYPLIATRDATFTFNMFWALPKSQQYLTENNFSEQAKFGANIGLTLFGAAASHPFDTVATKLQKHHGHEKAMDVAKQIYAKEGLRGFYRGFVYRAFMFGVFSNCLPLVTKLVSDHVMTPLLAAQQQPEPPQSHVAQQANATPRLGNH